MRSHCTRTGAVVSFVLAQLSGLSAGAQSSKIRDLPEFDAIAIGGSVNLLVWQGSEYRVEVTADSGELADLVTEVSRGKLEIYQEPKKRGWFGLARFDDYRVDITLPELRALDASGGSEVRVDGRIDAERLAISASGGADVSMTVAVNDLDVSTSGGSDVILTGSTNRFNAQSSGGSDLVASELTAVVVNVQSSSGSDVMLDVTKRLVARASGGSDIIYSGSPAEVDVNTSGGADVTHH